MNRSELIQYGAFVLLTALGWLTWAWPTPSGSLVMTTGADVYQALAAPFDATFKRTVGGVQLDYVTGEQVVTRLNETLGYGGWAFRVLEHGIVDDEIWVLGRLTVFVGGDEVLREQFGSQKVKRSRAEGKTIDIGFDFKGAATDALKKCAAGVGVGLYLSHREEEDRPEPTPVLVPARGATPAPREQEPGKPTVWTCSKCAVELKDVHFKAGDVWTAAELAQRGKRKFGAVLCMDGYREAVAAEKQGFAAQTASEPESAPF